MQPQTVTNAPTVIFPRADTRYTRSFYVAKADDGGAMILVAYSRETLLDGGGIPYYPGTGRDIVGDSSHVGLPVWAKTLSGTSKVYRDEV